MNTPFPERAVVTSKQELVSLIFDLMDNNDAVKWDNDTIYPYLQAMAAWLNDSDGFYENIGETLDTNAPSWQLFADALQAAVVYE